MRICPHVKFDAKTSRGTARRPVFQKTQRDAKTRSPALTPVINETPAGHKPDQSTQYHLYCTFPLIKSQGNFLIFVYGGGTGVRQTRKKSAPPGWEARKSWFMHIGLTQQRDKLVFGGPSERVIANPNSRSLRTSPQTGVAIPRIEAPFLDNIQADSGKRVKGNVLYDDKIPGIRWRFPHQFANWFGMTVLFDALASFCKFQFPTLLR